MKSILTLFVALFLVNNAQAEQKRCGVENVSPSQKFFVALQTGLLNGVGSYNSLLNQEAAVITIPTFFHVINMDQGERSRVDEQMVVLNEAFARYGFRFDLIATRYVENEEWKDLGYGTLEEKSMKTSLREGDKSALNLYTTTLSAGLLGWATFPWDIETSKELDGVVVAVGSLPQGNPPYDAGITLVHEVGHWLGLWHTFQGGCSGDGDFVEDTPAQRSPTFGCPEVATQSCPDADGPDNIHNYMDYSNDVCLTDFSPLQVDRMTSSYKTFRTEQNTPAPIPTTQFPTY